MKNGGSTSGFDMAAISICQPPHLFLRELNYPKWALAIVWNSCGGQKYSIKSVLFLNIHGAISGIIKRAEDSIFLNGGRHIK